MPILFVYQDGVRDVISICGFGIVMDSNSGYRSKINPGICHRCEALVTEHVRPQFNACTLMPNFHYNFVDAASANRAALSDKDSVLIISLTYLQVF